MKKNSFSYVVMFLLLGQTIFAQANIFVDNDAAMESITNQPLMAETEEELADETVPPEASVVLVLGKDRVPPIPYSEGVRGYVGVIDWHYVPDLGFNKNEIQTITILKREEISRTNGQMILKPSLWYFEAQNWESVYNGEIPYLERLEFLEDEVRNRLSTVIVEIPEATPQGYYKNSSGYGLSQPVNQPSDKVVQKIMIVSSDDNAEVLRLQKLFEKSSNEVPVAPVQQIIVPEELSSTGSMSGLKQGTSIFESVMQE
ncbi:MAG: hypothetical protein ACRCY4_05105 [Brevinema sp.]